MKTLQIIPDGWPCKLIECPPGLFSFSGTIGLKSEYYANNPDKIEVFCSETGECFWGGTQQAEARAALMVQPVIVRWAES